MVWDADVSPDVVIYPPSENIRVDIWNGSAWQNLFTDLTNGWNNVTITSYLTSPTLTIRFKGGTETNDLRQDSCASGCGQFSQSSGRTDPSDLHGQRHRYRYRGRSAAHAFRSLYPSKQFTDPPSRRHRIGPGHLQTAGGNDEGNYHGRKRTGSR